MVLISMQLSIDCAQSFDGFIVHLYSGDKKTDSNVPQWRKELNKPVKAEFKNALLACERDAMTKG